MKSLKLTVPFFLTFLLFCNIGCGPTLQTAGGKVLVDGKAVTDGWLMFTPAGGGGRSATANIKPDGTFELSFEKEGDGLPPGEYKVTITADIFTPAKKGAPDDDLSLFPGTLRHIVPPEYNELNTTPLKQTVAKSSGRQEFIFDIPSKGKKK